MQLFEIMFLLVLALAIARLLIGQAHSKFTYLNIGVAGLVIAVIGIVVEGLRWQMLPAYLALALLMLASLKREKAARVWRTVGAIPLIVFLLASGFLTWQLPIFEIPVPAGPYAVGTFDYSITDDSRIERYAPERNRELYVEVWYPAVKSVVEQYDVRTLFQQTYEGDPNIYTPLLRYLKHIPTQSHILAPVAQPEAEKFPVLLFSHGAMAFTSQNQQLMEHLASHGYVIFSVGHPYDAMRMNLENAGTVRRTGELPSDIPFQIEGMERNLLGKIRDADNLDVIEASTMRGILLGIADAYAEVVSDNEKNEVLERALSNELQPYAELMTPTTLSEYLQYIYIYQHSLIAYRVSDLQFIADSIQDFEAPVAGFHEVLDTSGFGVFGMSAGGATAGEFCKIDSRCLAGTNLDGTQFGEHWDTKVAAPFLMFYHEAHQGGNDFAYLPPAHEFWDYGVKGTEHFDFLEVAQAFPILELIGMTGSIDKTRMIAIINEVQLNFFDHTLKNFPIAGELYSDIPEIIVRLSLDMALREKGSE